VADGLFHGLRTLLGEAVVDYPRRAPLYMQEDVSEQYGRGFGLYGLLPDIEVDRERVFERPWDLVVSAVMWRDWSYWERAWAAFGPEVKHAVVDGGDLPWIYPYGPAWWRPGRLRLVRAHTRATYFKREWTSMSMLAAGRRIALEPIAISYPEEKIVSTLPPKTKDFTEHIVDLEVGARLGRRLAHGRVHIFDREDDYLADLRASRFGVTTKRAGWDALRHLELAGAGAVPCFRRLLDKPPTCAPHGLVDGENCIAYRDADHLLAQISLTSGAERERLADAALHWARANTTRQRAQSFLERAL
jgi:hypothetical protein